MDRSRAARSKPSFPAAAPRKVLRAGDLFKLKERELSLEEIPMDFDSLAAVGSMAGSGGVIVMDDSRDMVWALNNINEFYAHGAAANAPLPRRLALMMKITDRMFVRRRRDAGSATLKNVADNIAGRTICAFGEACAWPDPKFSRQSSRRIRRSRTEASAASPPAGIHAGGTNRRRRKSHNVSLAHDPGWEKAGAAEQYESGKQESRKEFAKPCSVTQRIIGAAISCPSRIWVQAFLESVYEEAFAVEFALQNGIAISYDKTDVTFSIEDHQIGEHRLDFACRRCRSLSS